jgi:NADH dehydrogenase
MKKKIVIIGAGFGGLAIAKKLAKKDVEIVLIDKNNYHTFQPLLYQVATGGLEPSNIAYPIRRIFRGRKNVRFLMAEISRINPDTNSISSNIGEISYDYLVIASGSTNNFFGFAPLKKNLLTLKSVGDALNIRSHLMQNLEQINFSSAEEQDELVNIAIIGAGPTGVEISGALAEMRKKVLPKDFPDFDFARMHIYLFEASDKVLGAMSAEASKYSLQYLEALGINVMLGARVKTFDAHRIYLEDGSEFKSNTVIWTAGVKAATIEGVAAAAGGRIAVNTYNQLEDYQNIFAIGDVSAHVSDKTPRGLPMLAQVAIQQGNHLSANLLLHIAGKPMKAFTYKDKGCMAIIGRNKAVVDLPNYKFHGFFAWFVWMFIHLIALVGFRNRLITFIDWMQNYFSYDRPLGAIIRKYEREK